MQEKLSEKLGRPATVRTIGWGGAGYDELFFITRDLLQHRKVRMLVFYDAYNDLDRPNALAPRWFRFGDGAEDLNGLPLQLKAAYYFAAIIGMPHNLLSLVRSNLPADLFPSEKTYWENQINAENIPSRLGALTSRIGFATSPTSEHAPFEVYTPQIGDKPSDVCIYSSATKAMFGFTGSTVPAWQLQFARKFADLVRDNGCKLVLIHMPLADEMRAPVIQEREFWPDVLHSDLAMIGIPPAKLFSGMTDEEVHKVYRDPGHLNKNGQAYFTSIITPSLLELYAAPATR